jgi:hypothetical protein
MDRPILICRAARAALRMSAARSAQDFSEDGGGL